MHQGGAKVVTYIWKNILMSERKTEMEKKGL